MSYRLDRILFLLFGRLYVPIRPMFFPVFALLRLLSARHEISYRARIEGGLSVLHPSLGVVVSGKASCGRNLTLVGGNCIGGRATMSDGDVQIGSNVNLGVNAVILGPCTLGDNVQVGAGAVVLGDVPAGGIAVGVPAKARTRKPMN